MPKFSVVIEELRPYRARVVVDAVHRGSAVKKAKKEVRSGAVQTEPHPPRHGNCTLRALEVISLDPE